MKTVFTHPDSAHIGHAKSILESAGIDCFIQNELSHPFVGGSLIGPIKPFDPELVILNDDDLPQAQDLLHSWSQPTAPTPDWTCPHCHETVPGTMSECWACQQVKSPEKISW